MQKRVPVVGPVRSEVRVAVGLLMEQSEQAICI